MATTYTGGSERMPAVADSPTAGKTGRVLQCRGRCHATAGPLRRGVSRLDAGFATVAARADDASLRQRLLRRRSPSLRLRPSSPSPWLDSAAMWQHAAPPHPLPLAVAAAEGAGACPAEPCPGRLRAQPPGSRPTSSAAASSGPVRWAVPRRKQDQAQPKVRDEYLRTSSTPITRCVCRGAGNFSYRFYETLSLGRIPLFVKYRPAPLPFATRSTGGSTALGRAARITTHRRDRRGRSTTACPTSEFVALQRSNRQLWETYLRPVECYEHVLQRAVGSHPPGRRASHRRLNSTREVTCCGGASWPSPAGGRILREPVACSLRRISRASYGGKPSPGPVA